MNSPISLFALIAATVLVARSATAVDQIQPTEVWPDNRGHHIQAHCGGVIKEGDEWYWFSEDRAKENDLEKNKRFVACYSSKDLVHWIFRNKVLKLDMPNKLPIRELSYARSDQNAEPISSSHPNSTNLWKRPP